MPKIDVDEEEYRRLKTLETTAADMLKHPEAGLLMEQAYKFVNEKAPTPRLDRKKEQDGFAAQNRKELEDLKKQIADEKAEREKNDKLAAIQAKETQGLAILKKDGWTDEGITGVKKIMEEQGILDPMIAAAYFEKLHPPQQPVQSMNTGSWNFLDLPEDGNADLKKLVDSKGESNALLDKMAREALGEIRGAAPRR
jgi:hypothetical protein